MQKKTPINKIDSLGFKSIRSLAKSLKIGEDRLAVCAESCRITYPYKSWKEPKKSGKGFRLIEEPEHDLKIVQFRINALLQRLKLPDIFHGCYKKTHIKTNADRHLGQRHFEQFDLANYYQNLRFEKVFAAFRSLDCSTKVASLLTRLTTVKGHVPQGAPTSPMIAVLTLLGAETRFRGLCEKIDARITIYGDNICISGPPHIRTYAATFQSILFQEGFIVNLAPEKRVSRTKGEVWPLPGLQIEGKKIDVEDGDFVAIKTILADCRSLGKQGLAERVCPRFSTKIAGLFYHYRWVATTAGKLSKKGRKLQVVYSKIQWPENCRKDPCSGNKCLCEI